MKKKMDIELNVDVTEELELEAKGTFKGTNFIGKMSKAALKLVTKEIGEAVVNAMSKTNNKEEKETKEVTEEVTEEEVLV